MNRSSLDIPWARTDMGLSRCDVKGARLWNNNSQAVNPFFHKKSFHKQLSKVLLPNFHVGIKLTPENNSVGYEVEQDLYGPGENRLISILKDKPLGSNEKMVADGNALIDTPACSCRQTYESPPAPSVLI